MGRSKIVYYGETLIDLTQDTITAPKLLVGYTAHGADGEPIDGSCDFDVNSSAATAKPEEVLAGKTYAKGGKMNTGTMPNNGAATGSISTKDGTYTIAQGYHDGGGKVAIADAEKAKLIAANIREGITLLGVAGSMSGTEDAIPQAKTVTPAKTQQEVLPDSGYNFLSSVTVLAVPYTESDNTAGGITVTIGG